MPLLGCIAADLAIAMEFAAELAAPGLRCVVLTQSPGEPADAAEADALVIVLATPGTPAVGEALAALAWLHAAGCRQFCYAPAADLADAATGAVGDALIAALGCGFALVCTAHPARGRCIFQGHLFLGASLASAALVRVLSRHTDGTVALLPYATVAQGSAAVRRAITALREQGCRYALADAVDAAQVLTLGAAVAGQALVCGSGGLATGLAAHLRSEALPRSAGADGVTVAGRGVVLAGACSRAALFQIGTARAHMPVLELNLLAQPDPALLIAHALAWAEQHRATGGPLLISAATAPQDARPGPAVAATLIQDALAGIAGALVTCGVTQFVVAGEAACTAVVNRLGVRHMRIGPAIVPGVPWAFAHRGDGASDLLLALSDGHDGARDLFVRAFEMLRED